MNAQEHKWIRLLVNQCAEVKAFMEINVYFEVDGILRYFLLFLKQLEGYHCLEQIFVIV